MIKLSIVKDKARILNTARGKHLFMYRGTPLRLSADFSAKTLQARREWKHIFKALKVKRCQPRICYLAKLSFRIEKELKSFPDKQS